ncbi:MAG: D-alanyl-D-alanine carboxypeptidase [Tissierellales bacterium]|nr:D-alanyl-D-alanine carboxypeptidase [Tissierellales bacterium]MBN2826996.1 D-alanyl-D-alanine carboxypeptidase [Tissierellales bacterium]
MKKIFLSTLLILLGLFLRLGNVYAVNNMTCASSLLVDGETGKMLFEYNANEIKYPASLTKLMTAIVALEQNNLNDKMTVDDTTPFTIDGSHIALEPGEILTLSDLLHALLIPSANDAAEVIAINCSGSVEAFVKLMNEKALSLGMNNTHFTNPHGLHDPDHYSTATDLSKLAVYAYQNNIVRDIIKKQNYIISKTNIKLEDRYLNNTNRLLTGTGYGNQILIDGYYQDIKYTGATGMKNGYTPQAGSCLIGSAERNNMTLITIVLDGYINDVYLDTVRLMNYGFDNFEKIELIHENTYLENKVLTGNDNVTIPVIARSGLTTLIKKGSSDNVQRRIIYDDLTFPLESQSSIGKLIFVVDDNEIGSVELFTPIEIQSIATPSNKFDTKSTVRLLLVIFLILIVLIVLLRIYNKIRLYKIRKIRNKRKTGNN